MSPLQEKLLARLDNRPILVWGARMTGMGFLRFARKHRRTMIGFIDSDPSLQGKVVNGCPVYAPDAIPGLRAAHPDLIVVIAVSLKEDEIVLALREWGLGEGDSLNFSAYTGVFFTIDIAGSCNLRCPSCAHGMDYTIPKGLMSEADFVAVTAKMMRDVEIVSHVSLYSWGEPFLHPKLDRFIAHLHQQGIAVAVSTNLSYKFNKKIEEALAAAPDYLKISTSGYYQEAYEATHAGGDLALVLENLRKVRETLDRTGAATLVDVNYHLYRNNNRRNLARMKELCDELGFGLSTTYALVMPLERVLDHCDGHPDEKTAALSRLLLVDIDEGRAATRAFHHLPCRFLTNQVNINWDRSVALCCVCYDRPQSVISDDYLTCTMAEIEGRKRTHPLCRKCMAYGLPAYNLGLNGPEWRRIAEQKSSLDEPA